MAQIPIQLQYRSSQLQELLLKEVVLKEGEAPTFNFETSFQIKPLDKQIEAILKIRVLLHEEVAYIKTKNTFDVSNFEALMQSFNDKLPPNFLTIPLSISFSTTRGMFMQIAANSALRDIVFPIINPDELVSKMVLTAK